MGIRWVMCMWGAQERRRVKEAEEESPVATWGCGYFGNTVTFFLTTTMCPAKSYIVQLPLWLRNGTALRGSDANNAKINTMPEFPSGLPFVSHLSDVVLTVVCIPHKHFPCVHIL